MNPDSFAIDGEVELDADDDGAEVKGLVTGREGTCRTGVVAEEGVAVVVGGNCRESVAVAGAVETGD